MIRADLKRHLRVVPEGATDGLPACGVGPRYQVTAQTGNVTCERCRRSTHFPTAERAIVHRDVKPGNVPLLDWARRSGRPIFAAARLSLAHVGADLARAETLSADPASALAALDDVARALDGVTGHLVALREALQGEENTTAGLAP